MVYVAGRENVSHVWVAGNLMLENHTLTGSKITLAKNSYPYGKLESVRVLVEPDKGLRFVNGRFWQSNY